MKTSRRMWIACTALQLALVAAAQAHHSFTAVFDGTKPVTLNGTVVKFEFINPHGWVTLEVPGAQGTPSTNWRIEVANPNALIRLGWRRDSLKPGDKVTIDAFRAHDGSNTAFGKEFKLADGRTVLSSQAPQSN